MDDLKIQSDAPEGRAAGRLSLKVMLLSLLFIVAGVGGSGAYLIIQPMIAQERAIRMLEGAGVTLARHSEDPEPVMGWIRARLGQKPPLKSYSGPWVKLSENEMDIRRIFRHLTEVQISPGKSPPPKGALDWLAECPNLKTLTLTESFTDEDLEGLRQLGELGTLNISAAKLTGAFAAHLPPGSLSLTIVKGRTNQLWANGLIQCSGIKHLNLMNTEVDPQTLRVILTMPDLQSISLYDSELHWPADAEASGSDIQEFTFDLCVVPRQVLVGMGKLPRLKTLSFNRSRISGPDLAELAACQDLALASFVRCRITGEFFAPLTKVRSLTNIMMLGNFDLSLSGSDQLQRLTKLKAIILDGSRRTEPLKDAIKKANPQLQIVTWDTF